LPASVEVDTSKLESSSLEKQNGQALYVCIGIAERLVSWTGFPNIRPQASQQLSLFPLSTFSEYRIEISFDKGEHLLSV